MYKLPEDIKVGEWIVPHTKFNNTLHCCNRTGAIEVTKVIRTGYHTRLEGVDEAGLGRQIRGRDHWLLEVV